MRYINRLLLTHLSFASRLNSNIRVPMLLVAVSVFCLLKTASKYAQTYYFGDKNVFFSGEGSSPLHNTPPTSMPTTPRPPPY